MNIRPLNELFIYRHRYNLGYVLLIIITVGLLTLSFSSLPPGFTKAEETSAVKSAGLVFDKNFLQHTDAVNLPYHLLQRGSLEIFGLSPMGVRGASVVLAMLSASFLFFMLRRWLQQNVAVVMGILLATSTWFLSIGRLGTPDIMLMFWTTLILLLATMISQETRHYYAWKTLIIASIGLSLYTPYMDYLLITAAIATIAQPHLRYLLRYAEKTSITLGIFLFGAFLIPLGWNIWLHPSIAYNLLAVPTTLPDPGAFLHHLIVTINNLVNPFHVTLDILPTPLISIPIAALAAVGLWRVVADFHSVRSHVLLLWIAVLIPVVGLNDQPNPTILFVPVMLLCAIGVQYLFRYWYNLFPLNPYARFFGLIPLAVLLFSIVQFNYTRYFMALPYSENVATLYDRNPLLLHTFITSSAQQHQKMLLIVPPEQVELYSINHAVIKDLEVVAPNSPVKSSGATSVIVAESVIANLNASQTSLLPRGKTQLLVDDLKNDALRFRVFSQ